MQGVVNEGSQGQMTGATDPRLLAVLDEPVTRRLAAAARGTACHLVGGLLRDRLLGVAASDFDAVVEADGRQIGERLARSLPARLVLLGGKAFAAYRLAGNGFTLDIWDRQGQSLEEDLARRDLTVNAFALDIVSRRVIDPFDGLSDLAGRRLRATGAGVFDDDPLRVLRLVRLALQLPGFRIEPATLDLAGRSSDGLGAVAVERVRDELGKVLRAGDFLPGFALLVALDLYPGLFLGSPGEPGDAARAERWLRRLEPALAHLAAEESLPHGRLEPAAPRLAALIAGLASAPGATAARLEAWHQAGFTNRRQAALCRRLLAGRTPPRSNAESRWWLHRWGADWPAAAAMLAAAAEPRLEFDDWRGLLRRWSELAERQAAAIFAPPALLDGGQIAALLGLQPGPAVGAAVRRLLRAQVEGQVTDRAAAEAFLRRP